MKKQIVVTSRQVSAAQSLVRISGGPDKVESIIRKIAEAKPRTRHRTFG